MEGDEIKRLEKICSESGGKIVGEWNESVTHVVCAVDRNGVSRRTLKWLCGQAAGCWVISKDWLTEVNCQKNINIFFDKNISCRLMMNSHIFVMDVRNLHVKRFFKGYCFII